MSEIQNRGHEQVAAVSAAAGDEAFTDAVSRDAPAVVAVVVACNPGPHFEETLSSLANQDYENLSVLVVDAGSDEPIAERVAEVLPKAYLHRLAGDPGFSVAANQSLELVSGSPFLLFCHDDVQLERDCVSMLMSELYRNNGGIAGPKLVSWDDSRRLAQLGMGSDRFGVPVDQVERGEFDQDQYDSVRDVFVAPGGVQLIRSDLFAALGGFDPAIKVMGEDLDLCWRAQIAGARVLVVPSAKARHLEAMDNHINARERRRLLNRHRLRTVMATAERRTLLTYVPMAFMLIVLESLFLLVAGRRSQARDVAASIPWNLARLDGIRRRRQLIRRTRSMTDGDVAALQMRGSARVASFSRGQFSAGQDRFTGMVGSVRSSFAGQDAGNVRDATVIGSLIVLLLVFGSRHLLTRGVASVGQFPHVPGGVEMIREWFGGWRSTGTGGPGNAPSAILLLAIGRVLFFWASGLYETLVAIGPLLLAPVAMYRALRPLASARAAMIAALLYVCNPIVPSAFSAGRWDSLVIFLVAPQVLASLHKLSGVSPFGPSHGDSGPTVADRSIPVRIIRFSFLVALAAAFVPAIVPIAVVVALTMAAVALGTGKGLPNELALAGVGAVIVPVALHGPWSFDFLQHISWSWVVGPKSPEASFNSMMDLVRFSPGALSGSYLIFGLLFAAALALFAAHDRLLPVALNGWAIAAVFWGLTWIERRGWMPVEVPAAESMLALAAAGLSFAIAAGVRSVEIDLFTDNELTDKAVKLSQGGVVLGSLFVAMMALLGTSSALDGRWRSAQLSFSSPLESVVRSHQNDNDILGPSRVLWIGDPSVLPLDALRTPGGINYVVTDGATPEVWGRWQAGPVGSTAGIGSRLDLANEGEVVRLGRLLAPYGIDHVVLIEHLAPPPYDQPSVAASPGIAQALGQQLDLELASFVPDLTVFQNSSSRGVTPLLASPEAAQANSVVEQLDVDFTTGSAQLQVDRPGRWRVEVPADSNVLIALNNNGLSASGARTSVSSGLDDLAVLPRGPGGEVVIEYTARVWRRLAILGQFLIVAVGALLAQTRRERSL